MLRSLGYRASRQFILLLIPFTLVGVLLLFGYYQILPEPTCYDLTKNQGEESVDCGGPCTSCLFKNVRDIQVFFVKFDEVSPGIYDVVAKVKNPNDKLLAQKFFYEITLRDDKGVIMQKRNGQSYLYAGETAHIIEAGIPSKRKTASADFSINNKETEWIIGKTKQPVILSGDKSAETIKKDNTAAMQLRLKIFNEGFAGLRDIEIGILVLDNDKNINALNKTFVELLPGGESAQLIFSWPGEFKINTANILVEPRVNLISE